jgi:desulfoferrodoxin (superoxide reductase-like protein)
MVLTRNMKFQATIETEMKEVETTKMEMLPEITKARKMMKIPLAVLVGLEVPHMVSPAHFEL